MALVELMAAEKTSWAGILVAALGSSAIGAVFGGYLTTRMRERFEREEAWRNRLIDAADDYNKRLVDALWKLGGLLPSAARGNRQLRTGDELAEETKAVLDSVADCLHDAEVRFGHMELLFRADSPVVVHGLRVLELLQRSRELVLRRDRALGLVDAVLAERDTLNAGKSRLVEWRDIKDLETLIQRRWRLPETFDRDDDRSVAQWARALHQAAGEEAHEYMRSASDEIENYRIRRRHRGRVKLSARSKLSPGSG